LKNILLLGRKRVGKRFSVSEIISCTAGDAAHFLEVIRLCTF